MSLTRPPFCLALATLLIPFGLSASARAADEKKPDAAPEAPRCPVSGDPANLAVSVATDAGPVFFCCGDCIDPYQKNPKEYADKVEAQRKTLAKRDKVQVACPVSGKPADSKVSLERDGDTVHFCCADCIKPFSAEPEKYARNLANSYTYQTICPVMKHKIDPTSFTELADGRRIYYCCDGCGDKLFGKPAKYALNLAKQGYQYNWAKIKPAEESTDDAHQTHEHKSQGASEHH